MNSVMEQIHERIFQSVIEHLNKAYLKPQRQSLEMELWRNPNEGTDELKSQLQITLPCGPWENPLFFLILHRMCGELQIRWIRESIEKMRLNREERVTRNQKNVNVRSEVQRFVGWALQQEKRMQSRRKGEQPESLVKALTKMIVFDDDIKNLPEYNGMYEIGDRICNKGGWSIVRKELYKWASCLICCVTNLVHEESIAAHQSQVLKEGISSLKENKKLEKLFKEALSGLDIHLDEGLTSHLHDKLITKVFHAQSGVEIRNYFAKKEAQMSLEDGSRQTFRGKRLAEGEARKAKKKKKT